MGSIDKSIGGTLDSAGKKDFKEVTTDELVDGGGIFHTGRIADLGEVFLAVYDKTVGGGSVTDNSGVVEIREPGNASATSESRIYSHIFEFDPATNRKITVNIQNITIDNNADARIYIVLDDAPDSTRISSGGDLMAAEIKGNGGIRSLTQEGGTISAGKDNSQSNSYVSGLNSIELDWDGSSLTVTTNDGSTTISVSESGNYPSGETLHLKIEAADVDGNNARNCDFDVDSVVIE